MSNTLDRQLTEIDELPEEIVVTGDEGYEYGRTREEETGLIGAFRNLYTPVRRKVIEPEVTTYTQAVDAMPGEYTKTYKPAVYGEEEVGFEYAPIVRGSKAAFDYAVDLFDSGEVMDKAIDAISAVPSAMSDAISDQVTAGMGMMMGYESMIDRDGTEIRYDPLMAPATVAPAGIAARVVAKESGDTVLGIFGGKLGTGAKERVDLEQKAVEEIKSLPEVEIAPEAANKIVDGTSLVRAAAYGDVTIKMRDEMGDVIDKNVHPMDAARLVKNYVFQRSGVFLGEDNIKRYEINTADVNLGPGFLKSLEDVNSIEKINTDFNLGVKLPYAIDFPELFENYPHLRDYNVEYLDADDIAEGIGGHHDITTKTIRMNPKYVPKFTQDEDTKREYLSIMLHEMQHAVDRYEGRQAGANKYMFLPSDFKMEEMQNNVGMSLNFNAIVKEADSNRKLPNSEELFGPDALAGDVDMIETQLDAIINDLDTMRKVKLGELDVKDAPPIVTEPKLLLEIASSDYMTELFKRAKRYVETKQFLAEQKRQAYNKYLVASGEVDAREVEDRFKETNRYKQFKKSYSEKFVKIDMDNPDTTRLAPIDTPGTVDESGRLMTPYPSTPGIFTDYGAPQGKDLNLKDVRGIPVSQQTDEAFSLMEPDTVKAVGLTDADIKAWRERNATSEEFRKSLKGRDETLQAMAKKVEAGEADVSEYRQMADERRPIRRVEKVPEPATPVEIVSALNAGQRAKGIVGVNKAIPDGDLITARLDINAYTNYDVWVPTLTHPELKTVYAPAVVMRDVSFIKPDDKAVTSARRVATGGEKSPFAVMQGRYVDMNADDAFKYAQETFDSDEWTQVGYDPVKRGFFYDRETGNAVVEADEVIQVGHLVLARNAQTMTPDKFAFSGGGLMSRKSL